MHRQAIERAIRYIGEHLEERLTLADVARVAHLSPFHFSRIFAAEVGEPPGRFITRQRMQRAAQMLAYEPERSVTDIGLSCGYSSTANFSKAFSAFFGCSPTAMRRGEERPPKVGKLLESYGKTFAPADLFSTLPSPPSEDERRARLASLKERLRYEVCQGIPLACLASPSGYEFSAVMGTWAELIERAQQLGIAGEDVDAFGISHDSPHLTAPELVRYHACLPCPADFELPAPLFFGEIPAGRYAIFSYAGPVSGVEGLYRDIYSLWLAGASVRADDYVPVEHYIHDWPSLAHIDFEVWIKLAA